MLAGYLESYGSLVGDKRTWETFSDTVRGIIGSESLVCARISASAPGLCGRGKYGEQRVRRMARGMTTKRSELGSGELVGRLQARGVEQLRDESDVWAVVDPSELRKPYAREMPDLMRVRKLGGEGTVPGYRTLNVLGIGRGGKRGVLYHRLFTSEEESFASESREIQLALKSVGEALEAKAGRVTYLMDTQFDDLAVWGAIWEQGNHLVCRLKHLERQLSAAEAEASSRLSIAEATEQAQEVARVRTEMLIRKRTQRYQKRQPVTAIVSAYPLVVHYQPGLRGLSETAPAASVAKSVWLAVVRIENTDLEPWLLLTDWPIQTDTQALDVFRMYRERWAIEDCFKFTKDVLGWEEVQLMDLEAIRTLVAIGWIAAGFLYELGVTLEWPEITLLGRLGGWNQRPDRPPGKTILTHGLQRLLVHLATEAILQDEIRSHGHLPPRIAALLGRPNPPPTEL